ncbi:major facilitator superfamily domain-containing protein [Dactylonectria macrodidyma]|uniref:Major facilitator superfamily domain-containing protein n=1 Tax=Dactylonectria macrodidyma TaxID=307937 RepID=A0A9P9J714_9HYPO|nr:major facilitator superfamily domain-containing protein [Dactylonectria macrodidyma]
MSEKHQVQVTLASVVLEENQRPDLQEVPVSEDVQDTESASTTTSRDIESDTGAWLCVLGSLLFLIPSFGFMASLGTIQSHLSIHQLSAYSTGQVGWISGLYLFLSLILNFQIGSVLDRYGPRILSPIGGVMSTATFLLMAECKTYWQFMLCFGVFGSIGTGIDAVTAIGTVGKLFVRRRGLAVGVAVMGTSIGSVIFPIMLRSTLPTLGWAWSLRIVALVVACVTTLGVLCYLPFPRLIAAHPTTQKPKGAAFNLSAFCSPAFSFVAAGVFLVEFVVFGIGGLLPTISTGAGFSAEDGYTLLSILGACSCLGRFTIGLVGDRLGALNTMLCTMYLIIVFMSTIFIPFATTSAPLLYTFSALWGFCSGAFYALSPVCTGKTCEPKDYARYYGSTNFAVAFSLLISIPLSGIMLENMGARPLACLFLALIFLAGLCFFAARALLIGKLVDFRTKM